VNSEEIREEQVRAASQATVYALLDHFDSRGFAGASIQCQQTGDRNKVSYEGQKGEIIQGEYKLNKHGSASVTRDENGGLQSTPKYRKRY
jgi:hypothetical protein